MIVRPAETLHLPMAFGGQRWEMCVSVCICVPVCVCVCCAFSRMSDAFLKESDTDE